MKNKLTATLPLALLAIGMLGSVTSANADLNNSIYVALDAPCRVGDTRHTGTTSIPAGGTVEWHAYGIDMSGQGGEATGCPQPKTDMTPTGIAVNITAVGNTPTTLIGGNLVAYAADATPPTNSVVNYTPGTNIANSTIVGLCKEAPCDGKFIIQSNLSDVPAIADVQGYFYARPGRIAHVATSGGDYSSPIDAMNDLDKWCGTPTAGNHCLLDIAPGTYDLGTDQIVMQDYVDMRGAGSTTTVISSAVSATDNEPTETSAVIVTADNTTLSDLNVVNWGGSEISTGIYIKKGGPHIKFVNVLALGGSLTNYGMFNVGNARVEFVHARASGLRGGTNTFGIWIATDSGGTWTNVSAIGKGGQSLVGGSIGVWMTGGSAADFSESRMQGAPGGPGVFIARHHLYHTTLVNNKIIGGVRSNLSPAEAKKVCLGNYDSDLSPVSCKK